MLGGQESFPAGKASALGAAAGAGVKELASVTNRQPAVLLGLVDVGETRGHGAAGGGQDVANLFGDGRVLGTLAMLLQKLIVNDAPADGVFPKTSP